MFVILGSVVLLAVVILLISYITSSEKGDSASVATPPEECCGIHEICEVNLEKLSEEVIYFDDEELDVYACKADDAYADDEVDEFREILYSFQRKEDIADWLHSLELRKISIPDSLKSEVRMILS